MDLDEQHNRLVIEQFTHQAKPFADAPIHSAADSLELLLTTAGVTEDDEALDVACGTGIVSCALARVARHVKGIDLVPAMLDQARKLQAETGLRNVRWELGDVAKLPYMDESFSLVITRYTFHHFADARAVMREMARVCTTGGRVVIADVTPEAAKRKAFDEMEKLRDVSHASAFTIDELKELGQSDGLTHRRSAYYELDTDLDSLLQASHSGPSAQAQVRATVRADVGVDRIGIKAYERQGKLGFRFPVSIFAWSK